MMGPVKYALLFLACSLLFHRADAGAIDALKTKEDVVNFLSTHLGRQYHCSFWDEHNTLKIDTSKPQIEQGEQKEFYELERKGYRSNSFYKLDIDHDGRTDLIVDAENLMIVLDKGDRYVPFVIEYSPFNTFYFYEKAISLPDGATGLLFRHEKWGEQLPYNKLVVTTDTLVCKFNSIVEYHSHPCHKAIQKIAFIKNSACFGDCENVAIEINNNGDVTYDILYGGGLGDSAKNTFYDHLNSAKLADIWGLLEYMDLPSLKSNYSLSATDQNTALLHIYFEDGSVKKISDYGFSGTVGLKCLYEELFGLQRTGTLRSWDAVSPAIDNYLIKDSLTFSGLGYRVMTYVLQRDSTSIGYYTFASKTMYCEPIKTCITLFPDHHFVFTDPAQNKCHNRSFLSLGNWKEINDKTIVLNWDGLLTLKTARDKEQCKKYFQEDKVPYPVRIENWKFSWSPSHDTLKPPDDVRYEDIISNFAR